MKFQFTPIQIILTSFLLATTAPAAAQDQCKTVQTTEFEGTLCGGLREGEGVEIYATGTKLYATYVDGKKEGPAKSIAKNGTLIFEGNFKADLVSGQATLWTPDGSLIYKGGFLEGNRSGYGEAYFAGGNTFKGSYEKGYREGRGKMYDGEGRVLYDGNWNKSRRNGLGTLYTYRTEQSETLSDHKGHEIHKGGIESYHPDLQGPREVKYVGNFSQGIRDGQGTIFYENGDQYTGSLERGAVIDDGKHVDKDGNGVNTYLIKKNMITPKVPRWAEKSMHCHIDYDIDAEGVPQNIVARDCTTEKFAKAARKIAKKWRFYPKIENGQAVARPGWTSVVKIQLLDDNYNIIPE